MPLKLTSYQGFWNHIRNNTMPTTKKKEEHCIFHPSKQHTLLCTNCGSEQALARPMRIDKFSETTKQFQKDHAACPKTWQLPEPPKYSNELSKDQRIMQWLASGHRGISSNTMLQVITGIVAESGHFGLSHPHDPADFNRCHKLLEAVPELREGFPKLAAKSKAWKALLEHWDELTEMLKDQIATGKANGMYERMRELISGVPRGKLFDTEKA